MISRPKITAIVVGLALAGSTVFAASPAMAAPVSVSSWGDLQSAFTAAPVAMTTTIQLGADINSGSSGNLTVPDNGGTGGAHVVLDLNGHHLTVDARVGVYAGIAVFQGASLTIEDTSSGGVLDVTGGDFAAGIGVSWNQHYLDTFSSFGNGAGSIVIDSGTVNATGGTVGAGIGGAFVVGGGSVTITGGAVTATGGASATGIGDGTARLVDNGSPESTQISITGGTVSAQGGNAWMMNPGGGAGIGIGGVTDAGVSVPAISISGCANVTATGGTSSSAYGGPAGIGAGAGNASVPALTIDGLAQAGAPTVAGSGSFFGPTPSGVGSPTTYSGLVTNLVTVSTSTPTLGHDGGTFTMTCVAVVGPTDPADPTVPTDPTVTSGAALAATGADVSGFAGLAGILALAGIVAFGLARRVAKS